MDQHLSQYKIFYEVAKIGNISKAAKELYISQPAISKSISKLEENFGISLFNRNSRGVSLTMEGQMLFEHIEKAFSYINSGEEKINKTKNLNLGKIKIGSSNTLCRMLLMPYLKKYILEYPHINIKMFSQSSSKTQAMLEEGLIDLGVITKPKNKKNINFTPMTTISDIFVATPEYINNLKQREGTNINIFKSANIMLLDNDNATRQYINDYFYKNGIEINNPLEVTTMDLLIDFAKIGMGIACVIKEFITEELNNNELIEVATSVKIPKRTVGFAYHTNNNNPAIRNFLDIKL